MSRTRATKAPEGNRRSEKIPNDMLPVTLREVTELLIKHFDLHDGIYEPAIDVRMAVGRVGPANDVKLPGVVVGVSGIGIVKTETESEHSVDASKVNPAPKRQRARK